MKGIIIFYYLKYTELHALVHTSQAYTKSYKNRFEILNL